MRLLNFLKKLFRRKKEPKSQLSSTPQITPKEPRSNLVFQKQVQDLTALKKRMKTVNIALRNIERRKQSSYRYSKFFKHRQPTTARKLWKPDARPED